MDSYQSLYIYFLDNMEQWGLKIEDSNLCLISPFPNKLDEVIHDVFNVAILTTSEGKSYSPLGVQLDKNYPWLISPHRNVLTRIKLIQLGYLTNEDEA